MVGAKDRETNQASSAIVSGTDKPTLQGFVADRADEGATVYTDGHPSFEPPNPHGTFKLSVSGYVNEQAHTNGIESFWANPKRGYHGVRHEMNPKHLDRYVNEFDGRHNDRNKNTTDQMSNMVQGMSGKRLRYKDLIAARRLPQSTLTTPVAKWRHRDSQPVEHGMVTQRKSKTLRQTPSTSFQQSNEST